MSAATTRTTDDRVESRIVAAVDGSALGNPGPAGWCWYINETTWAAGGWPEATNNQGELQAVIELLKAVEEDAEHTTQLHIRADSQYVINSITKWMPGWKAKGWKKKDGKPVLNQPQMVEIDELMTRAKAAGRDISFEWVKGHDGDEMNEAADSRARAVATAYQAREEPEFGPGFTGRTSSPAAKKREPAENQPEIITVATELTRAESDQLIAQAAKNGVSPREELAEIIRLGMAHKYSADTTNHKLF